MITLEIKDGKTYAPIEELKSWPENEKIRALGPDGFRRLKAQINELGEYKPMLVTDEGFVLGGNSRLKAFKELGYSHLWVSIVPHGDRDLYLKYNLSDNDNVGIYNEAGLVELLEEVAIENVNDFAADFDEPVVLADRRENANAPMKREVTMITCPNCGNEFPAKEGKKHV